MDAPWVTEREWAVSESGTELIFKASGTIGYTRRRAGVLLVFADKGSAGRPGVFWTTAEGASPQRLWGRVFGLGERRAITLSVVVGREESGAALYGDVLRARWDARDKRLVGTFYPPAGAAVLGDLYRQLRGVRGADAFAVRQEIASKEGAFGLAVDMLVRVATPQARMAPSPQAQAPAGMGR